MTVKMYISRCSCGFRSEPKETSTDAIEAYRDHEKDHAPGQRVGEVETVKVSAKALAVAERTEAEGKGEAAAQPRRRRPQVRIVQ